MPRRPESDYMRAPPPSFPRLGFQPTKNLPAFRLCPLLKGMRTRFFPAAKNLIALVEEVKTA